MKKILILLTICMLSASLQSYAKKNKTADFKQPDYASYFTPDRLRIDLTFAGNADYQKIYLEGLAKECAWSGSKKNLVDTFKYGQYYLELCTTDDEVIYSKGFNTLFQEWRTTAEAKLGEQSFSSSYTVPYPKEKVVLKIYERPFETGEFKEIFSIVIDPSDFLISKEVSNTFKVTNLLYNGDCENKVDLLFIAEGYTANEMEKFKKDAQNFIDALFEMEPYKTRKNDFNVWAVESISDESGTDIPHQNIWKRTVANSNFYTFRSDRYLTAQNQKTVCQIASNAPYDALYVIVNSEKYGGGGIYNFYGLSSSDHKLNRQVFVHEFGHSFAGLADEYYDSSTSYEDFYNLKVEPWEPNITTLVNFDSKWKKMLKKNTPIPTPSVDSNNGKLGVYEGGGYMAKGIYRPVIDCRMKTNTAPGFCPVCRKAIEDMIDYYTK